MNINVLLVEDDLDLAATVMDYFELEAISCDHAANGIHGVQLIEQHSYDVLLLDLNLPKLDGLSICEKVRASGNDTPILMLTARDTIKDKVAGFSVGTDDYLVKPFELEELLIRTMALSKRKSGQVKTLAAGGISFDLTNASAWYQEQEIKLTPTTSKLLEKLMRHFPQPVAREALIQFVWGEQVPDSNSLKVHIHHLRKQLAKVEAELVIENQQGKGFVLKALTPEGRA